MLVTEDLVFTGLSSSLHIVFTLVHVSQQESGMDLVVALQCQCVWIVALMESTCSSPTQVSSGQWMELHQSWSSLLYVQGEVWESSRLKMNVPEPLGRPRKWRLMAWEWNLGTGFLTPQFLPSRLRARSQRKPSKKSPKRSPWMSSLASSTSSFSL